MSDDIIKALIQENKILLKDSCVLYFYLGKALGIMYRLKSDYCISGEVKKEIELFDQELKNYLTKELG